MPVGLIEDVTRVLKKIGVAKNDKKLEEFLIKFISKSAYRISQ